MSADVAIAVVSWNTRDLLRGCIRSLAAPAEAGLAEVWVHDNASTDGSAAMVAEEFGWVNLIASEENPGFGAAVNAVAARTSATWIVAANADVALAPGALEALLAAGARPRVGAVAPRLVRAGSTEASVHHFPTLVGNAYLYSALDHLLHRLGGRFESEHHWDLTRGREVDWAHGALLLVRREAFEAVGGFDEGQWLFHEDLDLCWRLRGQGWTVRFEPGAEVDHAGGAAIGQAFPADRARREVATLYRWIAVRRGWVAARAYALLNLAAIGLRLVVLTPLAPLGGAGIRERRRMWRRRFGEHLQGLGRRRTILSYR